MIRTVLCTLGLAMFALGPVSPVPAQQAVTPHPIHVTHNGEDRLGSHLNFQLRQALIKSKESTLVKTRKGHVQVAIATQAVSDTLTTATGQSSVDVSVYTVTWLFNPEDAEAPIFLKSTLGHVKFDQVTSLAKSIAGQTLALLRSIRTRTASTSNSP